jgi:hypothetical protein
MNVKEFYDYITKHMTAEQALLKLLEGQVMEYDKLKFSQEENAIHPMLLISMAALDMGWKIVIPDGEPDAEVPGMIVGTDKYIDSVLDKQDEKS